MVCVSAQTGEGIPDLLSAIEEKIKKGMLLMHALIPFRRVRPRIAQWHLNRTEIAVSFGQEDAVPITAQLHAECATLGRFIAFGEAPDSHSHLVGLQSRQTIKCNCGSGMELVICEWYQSKPSTFFYCAHVVITGRIACGLAWLRHY